MMSKYGKKNAFFINNGARTSSNKDDGLPGHAMTF